MHEKEVISDIIGLNPTGLLSFEGTFSLKGANQNITTSTNLSKENLIKTNDNEYICNNNNNNIEHFYSSPSYHTFKNNNYIIIYNKNIYYIYILLYIILFIVFLLICIHK